MKKIIFVIFWGAFLSTFLSAFLLPIVSLFGSTVMNEIIFVIFWGASLFLIAILLGLIIHRCEL